jgi:uncharacterized membrane protein
VRRARGDRGSTIPLILGFFLVALVMVAAGVAAGDAFVQQRALQSLCDGAAVAAASSADVRAGLGPGRPEYLRLTDVQTAVGAYLGRDPSRADVRIRAELSADHATVTTTCELTQSLAFGSFFGFGGGLRHRATSSARAPLR